MAEYLEIETGKRDTLENRPELRKAISHSKRSRGVLLVAKLDRLTRSVAVLSMLQTSGVEFAACDNPFANRLTIQMLAAVAEDEVRRISERTKAVLGAYKAGGLLGASRKESRNWTQAARARGVAAARIVVKQSSLDAYADLQPEIHRLRRAGLSLRKNADHLSESGHTTRRGMKWNPTQARIVSQVVVYEKVALLG